jgi:hypothetical protein
MLLACLFLINSIIWQEDFTANLSTIKQLYEYTVTIKHENGKIRLSGNPKKEGGSSAWYYLDDLDRKIEIGDNDILEFTLKVSANTTRIKYFYHREEFSSYKGGEILVSSGKKAQTIRIPLKDSKHFYSGNYPYALTPGSTPSLFIFIDNLKPGKFDVEIERIAIVKEEAGGEE